MKFLTLTIIIALVAICGVQAFLPKLPKWSLKFEDESEEAKPPLFKFLFPFADKEKDKEKKLEKDKKIFKDLEEDKFEKEDKFEDRILDFFEDKKNAKTIFDKFDKFQSKKPVEEPESEEKNCKCKERTYDHCDDHIRYFS